MIRPITRIISDIHYGDQASLVRQFAQLRPLTDGIRRLVLNGDTLDTRASPFPQHTATCREKARAFAASAPDPAILSGNHDPDFTPQHVLELAGGRVVVTHGDILFDEIVPWGRDAGIIRPRIAAALAAHPARDRASLEDRFAIWRQVAASIPQRHQSEPSRWKYALRYAADTIWPPLRVVRILRAWKQAPRLAADFARAHWPEARYIIVGHTHRPGVWALPDRPIVINTGSFCPPIGGLAVDVEPARMEVRRIRRRADQFHPAEPIARFSL